MDAKNYINNKLIEIQQAATPEACHTAHKVIRLFLLRHTESVSTADQRKYMEIANIVRQGRLEELRYNENEYRSHY